MLAGSILLYYVPYRRLVDIKNKLDDISGTHVHYVNLIRHLLNVANCKQMSWSAWDKCTAEQRNELVEEIQVIDECSYVRYECISGINQQLIILSINTTIVNVTVRNLPGEILESCVVH
ncbi:unnamed protein product [Cercopithifilaria johnstoni]|uniref:Uncharacterized protein n=1 Tax=Cercopithifilaria johnstoni TaxID=2874296 RepID=A0A8J2M1J1_9BILA|nr:unnamed protein product [Cercopithifilaria johnstoni]